MNTIITDLKAMIKEHRTMIYTVVAILLIDHFFLGGKLKDRIKTSVEKLLGHVEKKVDAVTTATNVTPAPGA